MSGSAKMRNGLNDAGKLYSFITTNLHFGLFDLEFNPEKEVVFPGFPLNTIRGAFGYQLRRLACSVPSEECQACMLRQSCVFAYLFETPVPEESKVMKKYPKAPHPFIFRAPEASFEGCTYREPFHVYGTLVGKSMVHMPYIVYTFMKLGENGLGQGRGKYSITSVRASKDDEEGLELLKESSTGLQIKNLPRYLPSWITENAHENHSFDINMNFLTPLRVKYNGRFVRKLEFHHLIRNFIRRLSMLCYFHAEKMPEVDYKAIVKAAELIEAGDMNTNRLYYRRYSGRQKQTMEMGGLVGNAVFKDVPYQFYRMLRLMEFMGVGKNTTFGMGQVKVEPLDSKGGISYE